jgi:hypothetical protein
MLDRPEALAERQAQILGRDVVLEIDEGLAARALAVAGNGPERPQRRGRRLEAREIAGGGTGAAEVLRSLAGNERLEPVVEAEPATALREERDVRIPAARDEEEVARLDLGQWPWIRPPHPAGPPPPGSPPGASVPVTASPPDGIRHRAQHHEGTGRLRAAASDDAAAAIPAL